MEEVLNNIATYIALYAPIVVSILGSIITIVTSIKKIAAVKDETVKSNTELKRQIAALIKENAELKENINQALKDCHSIYTRSKGRK